MLNSPSDTWTSSAAPAASSCVWYLQRTAKQTHTRWDSTLWQTFPWCALPSVRPAGSDLGGEDGLPGLGDHVELLDGGGQVTGRSQVSQTHEATLGPDVVVRPVVPLIRSVRGWRRNNGGYFGAQRLFVLLSGNISWCFLNSAALWNSFSSLLYF